MNHHEWIPSEPQAEHLVIICREVAPKTGEVAVYEIQAPVTDSLISRLSIRSKMNMGLKYYAAPRGRWEKWKKDYEEVLQRKQITVEDLRLIGGIVEI